MFAAVGGETAGCCTPLSPLSHFPKGKERAAVKARLLDNLLFSEIPPEV